MRASEYRNKVCNYVDDDRIQKLREEAWERQCRRIRAELAQRGDKRFAINRKGGE